MKERLQKILSRHGVASRRQAEKLLEAGRVTVNGNIVTLGACADEQSDEICLDGVRLETVPQKLYVMLNKPRGYVTTMHDEHGRRCVAQLMEDCPQRVYPVGRLDQYSEGLLLLTNDGELANRLMHPGGEVKKIYHVWVSNFQESALPQLKAAIVIDGKKTVPAYVRVLSRRDNTAMLEFTLREGRNRQIRRLCEAAGVTVTRLKRIQEGTLQLGALPVGKWRLLTRQELKQLLREVEKKTGEKANGNGYSDNHT